MGGGVEARAWAVTVRALLVAEARFRLVIRRRELADEEPLSLAALVVGDDPVIAILSNDFAAADPIVYFCGVSVFDYRGVVMSPAERCDLRNAVVPGRPGEEPLTGFAGAPG